MMMMMLMITILFLLMMTMMITVSAAPYTGLYENVRGPDELGRTGHAVGGVYPWYCILLFIV